MNSIWHDTLEIKVRGALEGDMETDAAVIGGGLCGVLTAYYLQKRGIRTVLLEANRLGSGQTGNTTAKLTSQHGLCYAKLIKDFGEDKARQYVRANQAALEEYRGLVREQSIACDLTDAPAYLYTTGDPAPMREEAEAAMRLGLPATFTTDTELPFPVTGAVRVEQQAQFHPLKFLNAMAAGLTVYEQSRVLRVEGKKIETDRGNVQAKQIFFCCHFPFVNAPGYYFLRQHQERSYVLALEGAMQLTGMYLGTDVDGLSLRNYGPYLLMGGGKHRTGESRAGGSYALLQQAAEKYWPDSREVARWSAQDCIPMDGVPFIGRYAEGEPGWYVATGFQKWGMTTSMVAALRLSALAAGEEDKGGEVFSPHRFRLPASAKNLLEDGMQAVKGLAKGAVGDAPRCPHLGCQLAWNSDEESWDCPCHGSRFDCHGHILDGPAQTDL